MTLTDPEKMVSMPALSGPLQPLQSFVNFPFGNVQCG
ncbi:MAG: hypothetical protein RJA63_3908, partial [Pseudomonadota bacterium]